MLTHREFNGNSWTPVIIGTVTYNNFTKSYDFVTITTIIRNFQIFSKINFLKDRNINSFIVTLV